MTDIKTISLKIPLNFFNAGSTSIKMSPELVGHEIEAVRIGHVDTTDNQLKHFDLRISPLMDVMDTYYVIDKTVNEDINYPNRMIGSFGLRNEKFVKTNCLFPNTLDITLLNIDGSFISTNLEYLLITFDVKIKTYNDNKYIEVISF